MSRRSWIAPDQARFSRDLLLSLPNLPAEHAARLKALDPDNGEATSDAFDAALCAAIGAASAAVFADAFDWSTLDLDCPKTRADHDAYHQLHAEVKATADEMDCHTVRGADGIERRERVVYPDPPPTVVIAEGLAALRHARMLDDSKAQQNARLAEEERARVDREANEAARVERAAVEAARAAERMEADRIARAAKEARAAEAAAVTARDFAADSPAMLPGVLPLRPGLVLFTGPRCSGEKQSLGMQLALGFATASPPWPGAPSLPARSAVYVSKTETTEQLRSKAHALADVSGVQPSGERRLSIKGRDAFHSAAALAADLRRWIAEQNDSTPTAPVSLVVVDSAFHFMPEKSWYNPAATTQWLNPLDAMAQAAGVFLLLLADGADCRRLMDATPHALTLTIKDQLRHGTRTATLHALDVRASPCFEVRHTIGGPLLAPATTAPDLQPEVLAALADGTPRSVHAIAEAIAKARGQRRASPSRRAAVEAALAALVAEGRVNRMLRGRIARYLLADRQPTRIPAS